MTSKILMLWSVFYILSNCLLTSRLGWSGWTIDYSDKWLAEAVVLKDASPTLFIILNNITHVVLIIFLSHIWLLSCRWNLGPGLSPSLIHTPSNQVNLGPVRQEFNELTKVLFERSYTIANASQWFDKPRSTREEASCYTTSVNPDRRY